MYSPEIDGVVIRKKDKKKLKLMISKKKIKKEDSIKRQRIKEEIRLNTPKVQPSWTFADLGKDAPLRDFSTLPRDCWIAIFRHTDAMDVIVCGRVNKSLNRISKDQELWKFKLFNDFNVCTKHEANVQEDVRTFYKSLASGSAKCKDCSNKRRGIDFLIFFF